MAPHRLSRQISGNQDESEMSVNVKQALKTHAESNDIITNVISANIASTFLKQIFNSRDVVARSPRFCPTPESLLAG